MMRLQAITPTHLDSLKSQAERKERAAAEAREAEIRAQQFEEPQQSPILIP